MVAGNTGPPTRAGLSGRLWEHFLEHVPAAVAMLDKDMRYLAASRRYSREVSIEAQDLVGRSHYEIFPELSEQWKEVFRRCLGGATERTDAAPFLREDGRTDWLRWEIEPWRRDDGDIGGIVLYREIVTDQVREQQLRAS
jgi:PAS domain S-box-containing protein